MLKNIDKRVISLVLTIVMVLTMIPTSLFVSASQSSALGEGSSNFVMIDDKYCVLGDVLYENDFEDETVGTMPSGWQVGCPTWAWTAANQTTTATVVDNNDDKVIEFKSGVMDSFLSMPSVSSRNYVFEAQVIVNFSAQSTFGLAYDMVGGIDSAAGAVYTVLPSNGKSGSAEFKYKGNSYIPGTTFSLPETYNPDKGNQPVNGDCITVKLVNLDGYSYLYWNGILVTKTEARSTTEQTDNPGFYTCNANILISEVKVSAISEKTDLTVQSLDGKNYMIGDVLYQTDFENDTVGEIAEGWEAELARFGWNNSNGSGTVQAKVVQNSNYSEYGNVLEFVGGTNDAWISMPEINSRNYVYEATVIVNHSTWSSFGIAHNMLGGISKADKATYIVFPTNGSSDTPYYMTKAVSGDTTKTGFSLPDTWSNPKNTEIVKVKLINFDGYSYVYLNGTLVKKYMQETTEEIKDCLGFYTCNANVLIADVKVSESESAYFEIVRPELTISATNEVEIGMEWSFDKKQKTYTSRVTGDYEYSSDMNLQFGLLTMCGDNVYEQNLTAQTANVTNQILTEVHEQTEDTLLFAYSINVGDNLDKYYTIRPYILIDGEYYYCEQKDYCPASVADYVYATTDSADVQSRIETAFADSEKFMGDTAKELTFTLFADFHYKEGMYIASIPDLKAILKRADDTNSSFVMSGGDFCNDFLGSPELTNTYLNYQTEEGTILPAYNVYGNHELESPGNSMEVVTPTLTNDANVTWGTADGKFDASIGYYYFESQGFRVVCIDNQYSYNPTTKVWEHNPTNSYTAPEGNTWRHSLGPVQLEWLETVLTDAANQDIPCIVVGHNGVSGVLKTDCGDAEEVRAIFSKVNILNPGTVVMVINGHYHRDGYGYNDGVFYYSMNTSRNGDWQVNGQAHYEDEHTFMYERYDEEGNLTSKTEMPVSILSGAERSWFFESPLSSVVTVSETGIVTIDGSETKWLYDIAPEVEGLELYASSGFFYDCSMYGHTYNMKIEADKYLVSEATDTKNAIYVTSCICGKAGTETFEGGGTSGDGDDNLDDSDSKTYSNIIPSAKIEAECPAWALNVMGTDKLYDGILTNFYTSTYENKADVEKDMVITLDKTYGVKQVTLYPRLENATKYLGGFPENFTVSVWTGSNWVQVAARREYKSDGLALVLDFDEVICNAIRIDVTVLGKTDKGGDGKEYAFQLAEIEALGCVSSQNLPYPDTGTEGDSPEGDEGDSKTYSNVMANAKIQAECPSWAQKALGPDKLYDGILTNFYTSTYENKANVKKDMVIKLDKTYGVKQIKLYPRLENATKYLGGFPENFTVSVWTGSKWVQVAARTGYKSNESALVLDFDEVICNAIRIDVLVLGKTDKGGDGKEYAFQLAEIEALGCVSSNNLAYPNLSIGTGTGTGGNSGTKADAGVTIDNDRNIALNCPTSASSEWPQYNAGVANINNGVLTDIFCTDGKVYKEGDTVWAEINLLDNFKIDTVILVAREKAWGFPYDFTISVFYDGKWIEVVNKKNFQADENGGVMAYEFKFTPVIGNKVRISTDNFRLCGTDMSFCLKEMAVYGTKAIGDYVLANEDVISSAATVTATSSIEDYGYFLNQLTDGDLTTGWSSVTSVNANDTQIIEIDLKRSVKISEIMMKPSWGGNGFPVDFTISVLEEGKWIDVYSAVDYEKPIDEAIQRFGFDSRYASKIRITVTKLAAEGGLYVVKLNEIMAYPYATGEDFDLDAVKEVKSEKRYDAAEVVEPLYEDGTGSTAKILKIVLSSAAILIAIIGCIALILMMNKKDKKL